jgi:hypothetical protein
MSAAAEAKDQKLTDEEETRLSVYNWRSEQFFAGQHVAPGDFIGSFCAADLDLPTGDWVNPREFRSPSIRPRESRGSSFRYPCEGWVW